MIATAPAPERVADPRVTRHFHASAALYKRWSPEGHLHFGWWRWPMDPLDRRAMLEEMVHQVVCPLLSDAGKRLADLGCGYGTAARLVSRTYGARVDAFTVVPEQVREGRRAARREGSEVMTHPHDFRDTGLPDGSVDGVYAIESLCYGTGHGKGDVLREAARILKPGGTISLTDGFLLRPPTGPWRRIVRTVERGWALPCFPRREAFLRSMEDAGFRGIAVRDIGWNVAPSALHGLPMVAWTWLRGLLTGRSFHPLERAHLRSCALGILLGTRRSLFGYLAITAVKSRPR